MLSFKPTFSLSSFTFVKRLLLGKKMTRTPKKCLTGFLMAKHYWAVFSDPSEAGRGSPRPDRVRSGLYKFVGGMVRLMGGR